MAKGRKTRREMLAQEKDGSESIDIFFIRTVAPLLVLRLLYREPCYLVEIPQRIEDMTNGAVQLSIPYTICNRLLNAGLICRNKEIKNGRKREVYQITEKGMAFHDQQTGAFLARVDSVANLLRN